MELTRFFNKLSKESVALAGGKGASLGEMTRAGIPVPEGFVILSDSFEKFLEETDLNVEIDSILHSVNHKEMQSIEDASEKIKALILNAKMPKDIEKQIKKDFKVLDAKFVAVRSSATSEDSASAAWAGQLDSFLNTKENTLLENVKRCWASLFTPRAIFYRFEKGLHNTKISVAVVVQKMVNSEVSGIAFSVHPVTQDRNQLIIEAGFGLGEAIVSGQITPDSYVIEKVPRRIIDKNVTAQERGLFKIESGGSEWKSTKENGAQQKLSDKQIMELTEIILKIEKHYGFPCDIEWAFEGGKFYIVQSRPITTLTDKTGDKEIPSVTGESKITGGGLSEIEPLLKRKKEIQQFPATVLPLISASESAEVMKQVLGFTYKNFYFQFNEGHADMCYFDEDNRLVSKKLDEEYKKDKNYFKKIKKLHEKSVAVEMKRYAECKKRFLASGSDLELHEWITAAVRLPTKGVGLAHLIEAVSMTRTHDLKDALAEKIKDPKELSNALNILTFPQKASFLSKYQLVLKKSFEEKNKIKQKEALENVIKKYGWVRNGYTGKKELTMKELLGQKNQLGKVKETDFEKIRKEKLYLIKKFRINKESIALAELFSFLTVWQDERKESVLKGISEICDAIKELSKRCGLSERELLLLTTDEIKEKKYLSAGIREELKEREKYCFIFYSSGEGKRYTLFFGEENRKRLKEILHEETKMNIDSIHGTSASAGRAIGRVQICRNIEQINKFEKGNVLVASMTRPEYLPAMKKSVAVVTDEGGLTCHAAIVSRELGIPCVIGTKNATRVLRDGDLVEVKANHGQVIILERATGPETKFKKKIQNQEESDLKNTYFDKILSVAKSVSLDIKQARCSMLAAGIIFPPYAEEDVLGNCYSPLTIPFINSNLQQVILEEQMNGVERRIWKTAIKDKKKFVKILKDANALQKQIDKASVPYSKLQRFSDKEIGNYFEKILAPSLKWWDYAKIGEEKGLIVDEKLIPLLMKSHALSAEEAKEYSADMSTPKGKSVFSKERIMFLELCTETLKDKKLCELIEKNKVIPKTKYSKYLKRVKEYCKKYFYSRTNFYEAVQLNEITLPKLLLTGGKKATLRKVEEELAQLKLGEKELHARQKEWAKKVNPTKEERDYLWYFTIMHPWIDDRKVCMMKHFYYLLLILQELSARRNIPYTTLAVMTHDEIREVIRGNKINESEINARYEGVVFLYEKGHKLIEFRGEKAKNLIDAINSHKTTDVLKGTIACKGKGGIITGKVRIVHDPARDTFLEGEVLVTTMTRPEFVPIMKKAIAIITNEGGLTSHAAIVSRELGVPCIIGAKNASRVLKDGDTVEVDANKGIVKILEK